MLFRFFSSQRSLRCRMFRVRVIQDESPHCYITAKMLCVSRGGGLVVARLVQGSGFDTSKKYYFSRLKIVWRQCQQKRGR